jgi:glycerophosphoryl diester phosphodiesterase
MEKKVKSEKMLIDSHCVFMINDSNCQSKIFSTTLLLLGIVLLLTMIGCQKQPNYGTATETTVHFLGHRGGGSTSFSYSKKIENTIPSIQDGLLTLNGVEIDIQMSLDGTIWMFHNVDIGDSNCDPNRHQSIVLLKDTEIEKIQICDPKAKDRIYKFEELRNLWNSTPSGFVISMHLKLEFPSDTLNNPLIGGKTAYLTKFATSFIRLFPTVKYQNQIFIEVDNVTFCKNIQTAIPGIKICLIKEASFTNQVNDALSSGYDGVSSSFDEVGLTADEVNRARSNGLIVQLWTPDSKDELLKAHNLKPDFIQTNNLKATSLLNLKVIQ